MSLVFHPLKQATESCHLLLFRMRHSGRRSDEVERALKTGSPSSQDTLNLVAAMLGLSFQICIMEAEGGQHMQG